jgi:hypothetical protein
VAVSRLKYAKGFKAGQEKDAKPIYEVQDLRQALTRVYTSDAHLVTYLIDGMKKQPRLTKEGLALFRETMNEPRITVECFFCDVDNPAHGPWTNELYIDAVALDTKLEILSTAGIYHTRGGRRIVQPLATPLEISEVEPHLHWWLIRLANAGLNVDFGCKDWTRHYRIPYVRRDCMNETPGFIDLTKMRPIDLPPLPFEPLDSLVPEWARKKGAKSSSAKQPRLHEAVVQLPVVSNLPPLWLPLAKKVAAAVADEQGQWHLLFMALAGAMLSSGVPAELVPCLSENISRLTGRDSRTSDRLASARSTIQQRRAGLPHTGFGTLQRNWPNVAGALRSALDEMRVVRAPPLGPSDTPILSVPDTLTALQQAIERAPLGLTVIKAECGLGKTQAALRVAAKRATKPYADADAVGTRAPLDSKTSISVDKNSLAIQCTEELSALGQPSLRIFGPLSLRDANRAPVCKLHEVAEPLVAGGQRMQWELCARRNSGTTCPHYDSCPARDGQEGDSKSRITVGTHALLGSLDAEAGGTGLLIIDEVQDFLETVTFNEHDFAVALKSALSHFDGMFVGAMLPAVWAMHAFLQLGPETESVETCDAIRRFAHEVPLPVLQQGHRSAAGASDSDPVDCAMSAPFPERHHGRAPPLLKLAVDHALFQPSRAVEIGRISKLLGSLHHAIVSDYPAVVRVEQRFGERVLVMTCPREVLARALRRDGRVIVTDANADLHLPILAKVVGYEPPMHVFAAPDGAPIARTMIRTKKATRKAWFKNGRLAPDSSMADLLRVAFDWVLEDSNAKTIGVISVPLVEIAVRYAAGLEVEQCVLDWKSMKQPRSALDALSTVLGPTLARWSGTLLTAHYGATRGLNAMADADALITLGDPWPNLNAARADAIFLGCESSWDERFAARCRAELEQAHGRLRTVHRTRPGRALHVGAVMPGGSGWVNGRVEVRELSSKRASQVTAVSADEFAGLVRAAGGVRKAAEKLGCSAISISRYASGERTVPTELRERLAASIKTPV